MSNTLQLILGNVGAQAINFITIPMITRLYSPDSYGLLTIFISISMVIVSMSNLRLNVAILLPEEEEDAITVLAICLLILAIACILTLIVGLSVFYVDFSILQPYRNFKNYVIFMSFYVFLQGAFLIFNPWHMRKNQFKILSISTIFQIGSDKGISIGLGYIFGDNPLWLIGGATFGSLISTWILFFKGIRIELRKAIQKLTYSAFSSIVNRYKVFIIYSPINLLETLSKEIIPILFGIFFDATIVGFLGLANRIMRRPLNIFSDAITRSFFHELAEANKNCVSYTQKVYDMFYYLFLLGSVPVIIFSLIAPEFIGVIFGKSWESSGAYVGILAFPFFSNFLYRPLSIVFEVQERQGLRFLVTIINFIAAPLTIYLGALTHDSIKTVSLYSGIVFMLDFTFIFLLLELASVNLYQIIKRSLPDFIIILCSIFPVILAKFYWANESPILFIICSTFMIIVFFISVSLHDKRILGLFNRSFGRLTYRKSK